MKELIKIEVTNIGGELVDVVSARELHEFLKNEQNFSDWILEKVTNNHFFGFDIDWIVNSYVGARPSKYYMLSIDTAKKVAMAEQSPRGDVIKDYLTSTQKKETDKPGSLTQSQYMSIKGLVKIAGLKLDKGIEVNLSFDDSMTMIRELKKLTGLLVEKDIGIDVTECDVDKMEELRNKI